jgi:hypothetical protein
MRSNRLQLNADKTSCGVRQHVVSRPFPLLLSAFLGLITLMSFLSPLSAAWELTPILAQLHMFGCMVVSANLRQLRQLSRYVSDECFPYLVVALVHSRLDYGNFFIVRWPAYRLRYLQSVLNAYARLTYRLGRYDHIVDALVSLHWLPLPERIDYKLAVQSCMARLQAT